MKRFYEKVSLEEADGGWRVMLDGRPVRTQAGAAQALPTRALASLLADEWERQGEKIDPKSLPLRDLADYAIDRIRPDPQGAIAAILPFAETDTLCFRADPDEPLFRRQEELWEPLVSGCEARHDVQFKRVSGIVHRPHPPETIERLAQVLDGLDAFTLAALQTAASLAASLIVALAALEDDADAEALFAAANAEEDWQAELWGWDAEAQAARAAKLEAFRLAMEFARAARAG